MPIVKIVISVPSSKLLCNTGIFKTFRCQMAPQSRKLSYCSASQGFGLAQSQFRQSSWNTTCSEKLESMQHVFLLRDYNSVPRGAHAEWFCSKIYPQHHLHTSTSCPLSSDGSYIFTIDFARHSSGLPQFRAAKTRVRGWNTWTLMWKELDFCFWVI